MAAKPHIYQRRGRWTVAGNADVPWDDVTTARAWCTKRNRALILSRLKGVRPQPYLPHRRVA
jgi:hypothetical protein